MFDNTIIFTKDSLKIDNAIIFTEESLKQHDAEERQKFAEWLVKNMFHGHDRFWKGNTQHDNPLTMKDYIAEYERKQKNDGI